MAEKFKVSLAKIISEFNMEVIYTPAPPETLFIDEADVNRPGLQLMGFYEYFNPERIQILGKMEFAYLATVDEEVRRERIELLVSQKLPAMVITRELPYFPEMLEIADISKTTVCPLARVMRRELRKRGITKLPVVYSKEEPAKTELNIPGSMSFTPPVAGYLICSYVVRKLIF